MSQGLLGTLGPTVAQLTPSLTTLAESVFEIRGQKLALIIAGLLFVLFVIRRMTLPAESARPEQQRKPAAPSATDGTSPELIAILTAAATVALGRDVRVLGITEVMLGNTYSQQAWAREGRREIYISHRLR